MKRNRKRQIIWFNLPFNLKTKTKIGKLFLNLLDKHFPPHNKLHKLFNRTTVKISYSCMPNMNSYTYMHNHKVLNNKPNETGINNCNCRNKDTCPLPKSCQTKCLVCQKNFGKSKTAVEHQKSHGRLSEYVVPTIQTVNKKYEIAKYKGDNLLNKRTEIINTCRHRSNYKLANYDAID